MLNTSVPCSVGRRGKRTSKCLGSRAHTVSQRCLLGGESGVLSLSDMFYFNHHPTQRLLVPSQLCGVCYHSSMSFALSQNVLEFFNHEIFLISLFFFSLSLCRFIIFLLLYYHISEFFRGENNNHVDNLPLLKNIFKNYADTTALQKIQKKKMWGESLVSHPDKTIIILLVYCACDSLLHMLSQCGHSQFA